MSTPFIGLDPRYSHQKHGHWVRHKVLGSVGRICYYDTVDRLVTVMWEKDKWRNTPGASSIPSSELVLLPRKPEPWYDFEAIARRKIPNKGVLTLESESSTMRTSGKGQQPTGGVETMPPRKKAKVEEVEEDFDDLDEEEEERAPKPKSSKTKKEPVGIGAKQLAEKLGANAKTFRAWLRRKVAAGDFPELSDREERSRYSWGSFKDPSLLAIMKAWKEDDHTRGGRKKKDEEEEEE